MRSSRIRSVSPLVLCLCTSLLAQSASAAPPEGYRALIDVNLFESERWGMWAGSGAPTELETAEAEDGNPVLPIDSDEMHEGLPSLKISVTGESGGWWTALLAGPGWETWDHSAYAANGTLEFFIKGAAGGEEFRLGLSDRQFGRTPTEDGPEVASTNFFTVTTEWQKVSIPVGELVTEEMNLAQMFSLKLAGDTAAGTFWINDVKIVSPDEEPGWPAIKVNQVGYLTSGEKYALVSGYDEELTARAGDAFSLFAGDEAVYEGQLTLHAEYDELSGDRVLLADFSDFESPGRYVLRVEGAEDSPAFDIGDSVYSPLLKDTLRYFYYQRQGIELTEEFAGDYARPLGNPGEEMVAFKSGQADPIDVSRGWYDAGDYGKYVPAAATALSDLLSVYELFPQAFSDGQLNIPESGDGTPDILGEIRWELDWLLKMQSPNSGGFWHRVRSGQDENVMPHEADIERYIQDLGQDGTSDLCPTYASAGASAVLAQASLIYQELDADYAAQMLAAAEKAWEYLEATPDFVPGPGGHYYDDQIDGDNRLWAAASLFRATGESKYDEYFLAHYKEFEAAFTSENPSGYYVFQVGEGLGMELIAFLEYLKAESANDEVKVWFSEKLAIWKTEILKRAEEGAYRNLLGEYVWGSNMPVMTPVRILIESDLILESKISDDSLNAARSSLNYLLGANALSQSMVTGYGERTTEALFSNIYSWDDKDGMPAGYVAGGPNGMNNHLLSNFPAKSYRGSNTRWTTSEHTIYWNSPVVFVTAALQAQSSGSDTGGDDAPSGADGGSGDSESGCGCSTVGHNSPSGLGALLLALALGFFQRRRSRFSESDFRHL